MITAFAATSCAIGFSNLDKISAMFTGGTVGFIFAHPLPVAVFGRRFRRLCDRKQHTPILFFVRETETFALRIGIAISLTYGYARDMLFITDVTTAVAASVSFTI